VVEEEGVLRPPGDVDLLSLLEEPSSAATSARIVTGIAFAVSARAGSYVRFPEVDA